VIEGDVFGIFALNPC